MEGAFTLVCHEGRIDELLARLALHRLDLVISDTPVNPAVRVKAFNHILGECGVSFLAAPGLARRFRRGFPNSLNQAPMLLPTAENSLRPALEQWFASRQLKPRIVGEFDDSAMLKMFGQNGSGIFTCPTALEADVRKQYGVALVGRTDE